MCILNVKTEGDLLKESIANTKELLNLLLDRQVELGGRDMDLDNAILKAIEIRVRLQDIKTSLKRKGL